MPVNFHVVKFCEEDTCGVIHNNWLIKDNLCYWPDKLEEAEKYRTNGHVNQEWEQIPVQVICSCIDYGEANRKLKLYLKGVNTTDLESGCESDTKKLKSRQIRRKRSESDDSDQETKYSKKSNRPSTNFPKFKGMNSNTTQCSGSQSLDDNFTSIGTKIASPTSHLLSQSKKFVTPSRLEKPNYASQSSCSNEIDVTFSGQTSPVILTDDYDLLPGRSWSMSKSMVSKNSHRPIQERVTCNKQSTGSAPGKTSGDLVTILQEIKYDIHELKQNSYLHDQCLKEMTEKFHFQIAQMHEDIKDIKKLQNPLDDEELSVYDYLPLKSKVDFDAVEEKMKCEGVKKSLIRILSSKSGKQREIIVANCLKELLEDSFSVCCNFSGLYSKISIEKSWIYRIIFAVLHKNNVILSSNEIKLYIQNYLKRVSDSITQKKKRAKASELKNNNEEPSSVEGRNRNLVTINKENESMPNDSEFEDNNKENESRPNDSEFEDNT